MNIIEVSQPNSDLVHHGGQIGDRFLAISARTVSKLYLDGTAPTEWLPKVFGGGNALSSSSVGDPTNTTRGVGAEAGGGVSFEAGA